jgi:hypothetical protein
MRRILFTMPVLVATLLGPAIAGAQTMTEVGASAAGSAIGSAAGKKVSDGITAIFGKVDKTTSKAARTSEDNSKAAPLLEVGPGTLRVSGGGVESVPPPPPPAGHRASAAKPASTEPLPEIAPPPPPPPPAPPEITADDLKKVSSGTSREDLLKLGSPASRITTSDDGHLLESFSYASKDASFGRVKLTDGVVSSVEVW